MSQEERSINPGNTNPDDNRAPGAGGGEQPATFLLTNEPIDRPGARSGFEADAADPTDVAVTLAESGAGDEPATIGQKLAFAREHLGDDVFVLEEGSEIFNTSGLRVVLKTPAVVKLENGSPDPAANDQRFASFLHPSDRNWGLNIRQLGRPFDRARNLPLPLVCEKHGEDLEWEPYGRAKQCPKCAQEALALAAEIGAQPGPQSEPSGPISDFPAAAAEPETPAEPIKFGSIVKLRGDESWPVMQVLSVEFGIANCSWLDEGGQKQERTFGVSVLRHATGEEMESGFLPAFPRQSANGLGLGEPSEPIKVGDTVILNMADPKYYRRPTMTVLSIEFGIANCGWDTPEDGRQEQAFPVSDIRRATPLEIEKYRRLFN